MFLEWENKSREFQIVSGKFQNNTIKDFKQISLSHVIILLISLGCQINQVITYVIFFAQHYLKKYS